MRRVSRRGGILLVLLASGCAGAPRLVLPQGPGTPLPDYRSVFESAVDACVGVRTMELELGIRGRTGDRTLRGRVRGALERPASIRLEGVAPFGAPAFVLVSAPTTTAVLVIPRERRVVTAPDGGDLLGSLTGLSLGPDDFRAVLTGCLTPDPSPVSGRSYGGEWQVVDLEGTAAIYLRPVDGILRIVAGRRPGMTIEYADHVRGLPRQIHVRAWDVTGVETELTATLSQVQINVPLDPAVFTAPIRDDYEVQTLDQVRGAAGPLDAPAGPLGTER